MRLTMATDPGSPGWPNEDYACIGPGAAVLLDGSTTVPRDADIGCVHGVAWYARTLATTLLAEDLDPPELEAARHWYEQLVAVGGPRAEEIAKLIQRHHE